MAAASPSRGNGFGSGDSPSDEDKDNQRENLMFKMFLAHELATGGLLSDETKPPEEEFANPDPIYNAVKEQVHNAFWEQFRAEINSEPPKLDMAFQLIQDIKQNLLSVVTPNAKSIKSKIEEVLDVELMQQQLEHGALDFRKYAEFIISIMSQICASIRDELLVQLKQEEDIVQVFRGILETLNLMKLDLVKFALTSIKPEILNNQMKYEREKFNDLVRVENGVLPNTEAWLKNHIVPGSEESVEDLVIRALGDILTWKPECPYPETLFIDAPRLVILKNSFYKLCVACSTVLLGLGCSPVELANDWNYKESLKSHALILLNKVNNDETLCKVLPNLVEQFKTDANTRLTELGHGSLAEAQGVSFSEQIPQAADPKNKVRQLVESRILSFLIAAAKSPRTANFPMSLVLFKNEIDNLNSRFAYIANYNLNICREYYHEVIKKLSSQAQ
ncbi:T-complex protein 11 [Nesidiocoris tenuis]|nr:T-complex protein 11 [Nesidiocoris tenuis]